MGTLTAVSKDRKSRKWLQRTLIFHKGVNTVQWESTVFSTSGARTTEKPHAKRMKSDPS